MTNLEYLKNLSEDKIADLFINIDFDYGIISSTLPKDDGIACDYSWNDRENEKSYHKVKEYVINWFHQEHKEDKDADN